MRIIPYLLLLPLFASGLAGQTQLNMVSYPQDTVEGGWGNLAALGCEWENNANPNDWDEGRYQMIIPATHLPPRGCLIMGIQALNITFQGTMIYDRLHINASLTTATTLSNTFAANLPNPVACLAARQLPVNYYCCPAPRRWGDPIMFTQPFFYDGTSNIVLEFQKVIDRQARHLHFAMFHRDREPGRTDLPKPIAAWGKMGSNAWQAVSAGPALPYEDTPLSLRLLFAQIPTMSILSDMGGSSNNVFPLGGSMRFSLFGPAGSAFLISYGVGFQVPPLFFPIATGGCYVPPVRFLFIGSVPAGGGPGVVTLPIPNNSNLTGFQFGFQGIVVDPAMAISFTNAASAFINP